MQTVRQIERLWTARQYTRLFRELIANRPDGAFKFDLDPGHLAAAAMGMIRLDELNQAHNPLYRKLLNTIIAAQQSDGGWGDIALSALCLRALAIGRDTGGRAIDNALAYLANLQRPDGYWPAIPLRRMPGDASVSALVLYHLAEEDRFRAAVQFKQAVQRLDADRTSLDPNARRLWDRASLRCHSHHTEETSRMWSAQIVPNAA
ncbi:MAG TPA: prenyltransferase/squalene oxidase repeat-containing protein [Tepidisphaeraceae bacterium]|jgi:hypothetical protein|nr:prenyltransferase/squalene oxidase repeat-containing protein [Tepidisphaeraceae bacterium]